MSFIFRILYRPDLYGVYSKTTPHFSPKERHILFGIKSLLHQFNEKVNISIEENKIDMEKIKNFFDKEMGLLEMDVGQDCTLSIEKITDFFNSDDDFDHNMEFVEK